jgi:hypothetical protein
MRRKGHPSRPKAMTCRFFASLKTLLIPTKATALRRNQRPRASFPLAGFEVTLIGRFWVTPEGTYPHRAQREESNGQENAQDRYKETRSQESTEGSEEGCPSSSGPLR